MGQAADPAKARFRLERVPVPEDTFGLDPWTYAVPWVFRALAAPKARGPMPAVPALNTPHGAILGYWGALLHLLVYGFGWDRPDLGLRWWYERHFPTSDKKLALINEVWRADGQLDWFAGWLWSSGTRRYLRSNPSWGPDPEWVEPEEELPGGWFDQLMRQIDETGVPAPLSNGGFDPLHLSMHLLEGPRDPHDVRIDERAGVAAITLDGMNGWYSTLRVVADEFPVGWSVDVVAPPAGFIGTFKRSPATGLWFTGNHAHHLIGNRPWPETESHW